VVFCGPPHQRNAVKIFRRPMVAVLTDRKALLGSSRVDHKRSSTLHHLFYALPQLVAYSY